MGGLVKLRRVVSFLRSKPRHSPCYFVCEICETWWEKAGKDKGNIYRVRLATFCSLAFPASLPPRFPSFEAVSGSVVTLQQIENESE